MKIRIRNCDLELVQGDITESDTDAVVNPANSQLVLGGGVAGAIRNKGGPTIQEKCNAIGHCPVGGAVVTAGGNLSARYVVHAVGPRWGEGDEETKLRNATLNSLKRADENHMASIAFPAISTGIFGFPMELAAKIMLETVRDYLSGQTAIERVVFILFDANSLDIFKDTLKTLCK
ncbi:MAG: macro domain-containing protein [Nitrospinaceae bacterium]